MPITTSLLVPLHVHKHVPVHVHVPLHVPLHVPMQVMPKMSKGVKVAWARMQWTCTG